MASERELTSGDGLGSGGGTSGGVMTFCLGRLRLNPGTAIGFFCSELLSIYSDWVLGFF